MIKAKSFLIIIVMCLSIGLWHMAGVTWIYGKAYAATFLINDAWQKTLVNNKINKPWFWADTWPVAEVIVPAIGLHEIVLSGDSGATLAFAPGLSNASTPLDSDNVKLISAHRDTHFSKLKNIVIDDEIHVKTPNGSKHYRVYALNIVDSRSYTINVTDDLYDLVLATCYPFNSMTAGGYERFIVLAKELKQSQKNYLSYSDESTVMNRLLANEEESIYDIGLYTPKANKIRQNEHSC